MKFKFSAYCLALSLALIGSPVLSVEPADSSIKGALYDIEKYEKESASYTPARKSNIKRALKLLSLSRQRLDGSANKGHESWLAADKRLNDLQNNLHAMLEGGNSSAVSPAVVAAPAATLTNKSAEPLVVDADRAVSRIEKLYQQMQPGDVAAANKHLADLKAVGAKMGGATNKAHALWKSVAERYNQLNKDIVAKAKQDAPVQLVTPEPVQPSRQPAVQAKSAAQPMPSWAVAKIKRFERNIASVKRDIERGGAKALQDQDLVAKYRSSLQRSINDVNKLKMPAQPEVKRVLALADEAGSLLSQGRAEAAKQLEGMGDIHAKMAQIEAFVKANKIPGELKLPFTPDDAKAFLGKLNTIAVNAVEHKKFLTMVKDKAQLKRKASTVNGKKIFGKDDVQRQLHWFGDKRINDASAVLKQSVANIELNADASRELEFIEKLDGNNKGHRANNFLGEGQYEEYLGRLKKMRANTLAVLVLDKALGGKNIPKWDAQLKRIDQATTNYNAQYALAKKNIRMPKAASNDSKLLAIATETLAKSKYGVNPIERMVINSKLRSKEKKTGDIDHGTVSSTVTIYHYKWDEFQVATAEKVGDKYFLFFSTLKYFYSGGSTTPTDVWIMSGRFQGSEIPKENINK